MLKIICDHCDCIIEADSSYFIYYTGRSEADGCNLCKKCFDELFDWIKNKPAPADENCKRVQWDGKAYTVLL